MNSGWRSDRRAWVLIALGALAALFYSNFLFDLVFNAEHDWFTVVSELEKPGSSTAGLLRTTDVLCGLCTLAVLPWVWRGLPPGGWRLWSVLLAGTFAVTSGLAGLIPLPCTGCEGSGARVQQLLHDGFSTVSVIALSLGMVAVALDTGRHGPRWMHRVAWWCWWVGAVLGTILFGVFGLIDSSSWQTGFFQRFQIVVDSLWLLSLGVFAALEGLGDRERSPVG